MIFWCWVPRRWRPSARSSAWPSGWPRACRWRWPRRRAPLILVCALVGGLAFSFVGGLGAALALGSRRGGLLIAVIVLPLFAPPVIFGGGALSQAAVGLPWSAGLALLAAWTAVAVALGPLAMAAACRNAID